MKKFLHIISLVIIISILSTQFIFAKEIDTKDQLFTDLNEIHWAYESIQKLVDEEIILGYPDGTFRPDGDITRAELVKIVNLVFNFKEKQEETLLTDINSEDWFYDYVLIAQNSGYIIGYPDNTFRPNNPITRQEFCKVLDAINNFVELPFGITIADEVSEWALPYVNKIVSNRIMPLDENNYFRATEKATRAEVCDALAKFVIEEPEVENPQLPEKGDSNSGKNEIVLEEIYIIMDETISIIEKKVLNDSELSEEQKQIVEDIIYNMEKYMDNNKHDYESQAKVTYEKYKQLSENEKEGLENKIITYVPSHYLMELKTFFFPDVSL